MYLAKIKKYKEGKVEDLYYMHFLRHLPEPGKVMVIQSGKISGGFLRTSTVRWLGVAQSKNRIRYYAKTYNSMYRITINKDEL